MSPGAACSALAWPPVAGRGEARGRGRGGAGPPCQTGQCCVTQGTRGQVSGGGSSVSGSPYLGWPASAVPAARALTPGPKDMEDTGVLVWLLSWGGAWSWRFQLGVLAVPSHFSWVSFTPWLSHQSHHAHRRGAACLPPGTPRPSRLARRGGASFLPVPSSWLSRPCLACVPVAPFLCLVPGGGCGGVRPGELLSSRLRTRSSHTLVSGWLSFPTVVPADAVRPTVSRRSLSSFSFFRFLLRFPLRLRLGDRETQGTSYSRLWRKGCDHDQQEGGHGGREAGIRGPPRN